MWAIILLPVFALSVIMVFHASYSLDRIKSNWVEYRCNPFYMPFAGYMQEDVSTTENFQYCLNAIGSEALKLPLDAVNGVLGTVTDSVSEIAGPLDLFRQLFARIRKFMLSFTSTTLTKVTSSTSVFVFYLAKIRDVLKRFIGQGYIASYLAYVGVSFIESFVTLCITVIKSFIYAMLCIAIILALFQPEILAVVVVIASMLSAAGA
jgi:hypothetical protein